MPHKYIYVGPFESLRHKVYVGRQRKGEFFEICVSGCWVYAIEEEWEPVAKWNIDEALQFIRKNQYTTMASGWCLMLGGGVLNNGIGPDLDLMVYPRTLKSKIEDFLVIFPGGVWSRIRVADIYTYGHQRKMIEFIFQTHPCGAV